jgi:hypothetical protein
MTRDEKKEGLPRALCGNCITKDRQDQEDVVVSCKELQGCGHDAQRVSELNIHTTLRNDGYEAY